MTRVAAQAPTRPFQGTVTADVRSMPLLERALAFTRLCRPGSFVTVDPDALTRAVRDRVQDLADGRDVDVVVHCTCGPVLVEPEAFSEALYQLLENAVRETRRGHPVMVDVRHGGDGVLWHVQDAGQGMPVQDVARLGQLTDVAWPEGRGLGLALAWAVVEEHGGTLRFESAPGVGTTATIWLPPHRRA